MFTIKIKYHKPDNLFCPAYSCGFDKQDKSFFDKNMDKSKIIEQLFIIVTELDARECSNNSIASCFHGISWETLCNMGINLFEQLKK